jgi:N-glycosylase/DNA lyase
MKKLTNTSHSGAVSNREIRELVRGDREFLAECKSIEKKCKKKLKRVNILNGYVMTTYPDKYKEYEITGCSETQDIARKI